MRMAYGMIGIGFLVIFGGMFLINHHFTPKSHTSPVLLNGINATTTTMPEPFTISSAEFLDGGPIPLRYTCDGEKVSPHLMFDGGPADGKSLLLIVNDPDVPKELKSDGNFDHWILFNIPVGTTEIPEGMIVGTPGNNSAGKPEYAPPCPPKEYEPSEHRYFFTIYSLDIMLPLKMGASAEEVKTTMQGHVLGQGQMVGMYKRK
jgi:hypothetical protein